MMTKKKKGLLITFLILVFSFIISANAQAALYPFGGRIIFALPVNPFPAGPCGPYVPYIVVGPPKPGIFIIPPGRSFIWYQWFRVGPVVLGSATSPYCGIITGVGTSLF